MKYPTAEYLTVVKGNIEGPVRYESLSGKEYFQEYDLPDPVRLRNHMGIIVKGERFEVSIIQKLSRYGWIYTEPFGFYWWKQEKFQERKEVTNEFGTYLKWAPKTEKGLYFRAPFTWRRDIAGTVRDGELRHWIKSGGHLGKNWD